MAAEVTKLVVENLRIIKMGDAINKLPGIVEWFYIAVFIASYENWKEWYGISRSSNCISLLICIAASTVLSRLTENWKVDIDSLPAAGKTRTPEQLKRVKPSLYTKVSIRLEWKAYDKTQRIYWKQQDIIKYFASTSEN